ncbi:helix-turn-helix domain-containing protein [Achromobacter sp. UMC46]|uniref:helix-turn-helix domain-containing protein n=1 Tax=Achromobacter sp. UMC46 TaxID=1862319 RepID=UPI00210710FA|nr:helix-turn-helix domain-containing protein [Achromobacter sp. UMC46]
MKRFCLPSGMRPSDVEKLLPLVRKRVRLFKGDPLYLPGDHVTAVHAVRGGTIKTTVTTENRRSQVVRFYFPGEIVGLENLTDIKRHSAAIALEDTNLCVIPSDKLRALAGELSVLNDRLLQSLSDATWRDRNMLATLGVMNAEERIAGFLLDISGRLAARGFSASEFLLRMTREDIGSYLGLTVETVSRTLSRLSRAGFISIRTRNVRILDRRALEDLLLGSSRACASRAKTSAEG